MHAYVLQRLDAHLAELQRLRNLLAVSRPSRPGARWHAAAATVIGARDYATDIAQVLNGCPGADGPDLGPSATTLP
jgi:hypothetical protein